MKTRACILWCDRQWRRLPFVDGHTGDVSITRLIALYFAWLVGQSITMKTGELSLNVLWLALAAVSAAFGKSTFGFLLQRMQFRSESVQVDVHQATEIIDRRKLDQGMEATP